MRSFTLTTVADIPTALDAGRRGGRFVAGGTTLVDLMRHQVEQPDTLVDITRLPLREIGVDTDGSLRIGALATMADTARHPDVRDRFPVVAQALELSASAQLRNMATIGGNTLQRTRCTYFRDLTADCNKREPGSGCAAVGGINRGHAILGTSDHCVATHASDVAVAFAALDATVRLHGPDGERSVGFTEFFLRPGNSPHREHDLRPGELITAVEIPAYPTDLRSGYLKVRDRQSYEFALTSVAVALHIPDGTIRAAKVAAGGVGTVPWRLSGVEQQLVGRQPGAALWADAAARATDGARPLSHNGFKVQLLIRSVERQLRAVGGGE
ncbi:FAD binding domain-containing protein [Nocardia amikacinitolerans]|uniref:FAD binding domain-containing protein n=1 Tax=Nocardia amikacinitolerans TaxID=756689 RepID=UPI0020A2FB59|nr:xanthine dehydrogenase family protein subunit M [Nocardia amikacinitolerans]MCP2281030.1 xanthine dehydrogenase YagS FAD-binding subunit [Nocardia amikacinitolerans]